LPRQDGWTHPAEPDLLNASRTAPFDRFYFKKMPRADHNNRVSEVWSYERSLLVAPHPSFDSRICDPGSRDVVGSSST
jgi:hypothetical protein